MRDIQRVFLHEVGHGIGLNHPEGAKAVMNAMISDLDVLAGDDIAAVQALYGPPAPPPTPPPATPTTTAGHANADTSRPSADRRGQLANISTRMKVGLDDDVLIGGFIITGARAEASDPARDRARPWPPAASEARWTIQCSSCYDGTRRTNLAER